LGILYGLNEPTSPAILYRLHDLAGIFLGATLECFNEARCGDGFRADPIASFKERQQLGRASARPLQSAQSLTGAVDEFLA